nr:hypothetical protein CFP56_19221 [Quercus suber]
MEELEFDENPETQMRRPLPLPCRLWVSLLLSIYIYCSSLYTFVPRRFQSLFFPSPAAVLCFMSYCFNAVRRFPVTRCSSMPSLSKCLATKRGPDVEDRDLRAAREWLVNLNSDTIPRSICDVTFSRSSGPGGQNVNKILHQPILGSRYHAPKSAHIVVQADDSRKQNENVTACFRKLHEVIILAGREVISNETSPEQTKRVELLQRAEAAGRRKIKELQSSKKAARRGGERGGDD